MLETFENWAKKLDYQQINQAYDKSHISVDLVNWYNPKLLEKVTTIANLPSGSYGLFNSGEAQKQIPIEAERWLIYKGVKKEDISKIPYIILQKWGVNPNSVQIGDTIKINVRRILSQSKNNLEAVLHIASTIIHEATHVLEHELKGQTNELGPKNEENKFMNWAKQNMSMILQKYPELRDQ